MRKVLFLFLKWKQEACGVNNALAFDVKMLPRLDFQVYISTEFICRSNVQGEKGHHQFWLEVKLNGDIVRTITLFMRSRSAYENKLFCEQDENNRKLLWDERMMQIVIV